MKTLLALLVVATIFVLSPARRSRDTDEMLVRGAAGGPIVAGALAAMGPIVPASELLKRLGADVASAAAARSPAPPPRP